MYPVTPQKTELALIPASMPAMPFTRDEAQPSRRQRYDNFPTTCQNLLKNARKIEATLYRPKAR